MRERILPWEAVGGGSRVLVNGEHPCRTLPSRRELAAVGPKNSGVMLERRAALLLEELMAKLRGWEGIAPVSGWRSLQEQRDTWEEAMAKEGPEFTWKFVARPGHSEHHTGLAIDWGERREKIDPICPAFPDQGICGRFRRLAARYGFILRYPTGKEAVTGIAHEPWHFRYVGTPHALIMEERGLVLEEYIQLLRRHPYGERPLVWKGCGLAVEISFLPAVPGDRAQLLQREDWPWAVSGNNADGFIITRWNGTAIRERVMGKERAAG